MAQGKFTIAAVALLAVACEREGAVDRQAKTEATVPETRDEVAPVAEGAKEGEVATYDQQWIDHMAAHLRFGARLAEVGADKATHPELKTWAENTEKSYQANVDQLKNWRDTWFGTANVPDMKEMPQLAGIAPYTPGEWWRDDVKVGPGDEVVAGEKAGEGTVTTDRRTGTDGRVGVADQGTGVGADQGVTSTGMTAVAWDPDDVVQALRNTDEPFDSEFIVAMSEHQRHSIEAAKAAQTQATRSEVKDLAKQVLDAEQTNLSMLEKWRGQWYADAEKERTPAERMHTQP